MRTLIKLIPLQIVFTWIESHQDDKQDNEDLSNSARLNIQVDKMAGEHRESMTEAIPTMKIPAGVVSGVKGVRYHHFPAEIIRSQVHAPPLKAHILSKTGWNNDQFNSIEWETYAKVLKMLPASQQVNWIKLAHDWQHTGQQQMRFGYNEATWQCPFHCGQQETAMHFCECNTDLSVQQKTVHLTHLTNNLNQARTCPTLRRAIIEAISVHCNITVTDPYSPAFASIRASKITNAIAAQKSLEINHLLKGRVLKALFEPQLEYFEKMTPSKNVTPTMIWKTWRKTVIGHIIEFTLIGNEKRQLMMPR